MLRKICLVPESNQRHEDFQSSALPTELTRHKIAGVGFEPTTFGLWARRAAWLLYPATINFDILVSFVKYQIITHQKKFIFWNGRRRIRTFESVANRFTVCPLWPLGNPPMKPTTGLEPVTCWLQISCSANWATSARMGPTGLEPVTLCL